MRRHQPHRIDLNADLGEGVTDDEGLLEVVTSANLACGFHAGDEDTMRAVCTAAAPRGVVIGAQVPTTTARTSAGARWTSSRGADRLGPGAGRLLTRIAEECGTPVTYLKPHGALYNRVVDDDEQAAAVLRGSGTLPVLGLPGSAILRLAEAAGRTAYSEGFPDRGYTDEGRLVPRDQPGALVEGAGAIAANAVRLAAGRGPVVCVHGDSPGAVEAARAVRAALERAGYDVRPWA